VTPIQNLVALDPTAGNPLSNSSEEHPSNFERKSGLSLSCDQINLASLAIRLLESTEGTRLAEQPNRDQPAPARGSPSWKFPLLRAIAVMRAMACITVNYS